MNKSCTENILRVMELSRQLVASADRGDDMRTDSGCGVLFGVARDTGYRILNLAEEEKTRHQRKGTWDILAEHNYTAAGSKKCAVEPDNTISKKSKNSYENGTTE